MAKICSFLTILATLVMLFVLLGYSSYGDNSVVKVIYVSTFGNDANDGLSPSTPVRTLVKAFRVANTVDKAINIVVKVSAGLYIPGNGLGNVNIGLVISRPNIVLSGGWDKDFTSVIGKSELNGNNNLYHILMVVDVTNVKLENLVIRGGNAGIRTTEVRKPYDSGGGIYVSNVSYLVIESNVVISNNSAFYGGGLFLDNSTNNTISCSVFGNSANYYGGGVYLESSTGNTINGDVYGNSANYYGGGLYLRSSSNNTISGKVYGNSSVDGGGVFLDTSPNNTINGSVYNNSATNNGGKDKNIIRLKLSSFAFLKEKIDIKRLPSSKSDWGKLDPNTSMLLRLLDMDSTASIYEYGTKSAFMISFGNSNLNLSLYPLNRGIERSYSQDLLTYKVFEYNKISNYLIMNQIISLKKVPADSDFLSVNPVRYTTNIPMSNLVESYYYSGISKLESDIVEELLLSKVKSDFATNRTNNISGYLYFPVPPLIYEKDNMFFVDISLCILYSGIPSSVTNNRLMRKLEGLIQEIKDKSLDQK